MSSALPSSSHPRAIASSPSLPCLRSYHPPSPADTPDLPSKLMGSPLQAIASPPSPNHLQHHLYSSFLHRKTADVAIRIRGSWHAIYRLHRVVLIQAGFFQSLFTSGFLETKKQLLADKLGPDVEVIDIVFDDPNITRAAFEICISRLYGGGPPLHICSSLIPTASFPLTPSFPTPSPTTPTPEGHHPASPRFLLSLLATASFLHIPHVASQALTAVLRTVGPHTVIRYLEFAIGRGVGEKDEEDEDEPEAAVGLEDVAQMMYEEDDASASKTSLNFAFNNAKGKEKATEAKTDEDEQAWHDTGIKKEDPSDTSDESHSYNSHNSTQGPAYSYGAVSDKVGEAAACWLTRWGADMLRYEERVFAAEASLSPSEFTRSPSTWASVPLSGSSSSAGYGRKRATTVPSRIAGAGEHVRLQEAATPSTELTDDMKIPVIWRKGGLNARWVRGLLSSDALFVKGERERYDMATKIVEMRRAVKEEDLAVEEEEENEWRELFTSGIYYSNMPVEDLMTIAHDVSPRTGRPYVSLPVLQSAQWVQAELRHRIFSHRSSGISPPRSPTSPNNAGTASDNKLGLGLPARDLAATLHPDEKRRLLHPVPEDWSQRIGDSTTLDGGLDPLFETTSATLVPSSPDNSAKKSSPPATEANFFGIRQSARFPDEAAFDSDKYRSMNARWTAYPPFRFAVEFWDVDMLKEKTRLHSQTVWYAGSLYNVYVQLVKKKGIQLGVYLHRQSSVEAIPNMSAPAPVVVATSAPVHAPSPAPGHPLTSSISAPRPFTANSHRSGTIGLPVSRSITPVLTGSAALSRSFPSSLTQGSSLSSSYVAAQAAASSASATLPYTVAPVVPPQAYRDPRSSVSAYFSVACASATGGSLTRFTSAPDVFSVSQSWGWKSSSLRTEEYVEIPEGQEQGRPRGTKGREVSLRATVILGVV